MKIRRIPILWCVASLCFLPLFPARAQTDTARITVNAAGGGTPLRHVWEFFGYDECNYTTSPGGTTLLKTLASLFPEPVHIRTHFLLNSGNGVASLKWGSTNVFSEDASGNPVYSWTILDGIMDTIVHTGCLPLVEIAFMPQALTTGTGPYQDSTVTALNGACFYPPNNYTKWGDLVSAWASHSKTRYGAIDTTWLWELWNEPNIGYFHGVVANYDSMFDYTEYNLHSVMPQALLGGDDNANASDAFMQSFVAHCTTGTNAYSKLKGTRLDMVTFHAKGGTAVVSGNVQMDMGNQLTLAQSGFDLAASYPTYKSKPIIIGEADPDGCAACPIPQYPANAYRNVPAYGAYEVAEMKYTLDLAAQIGINLKGVLTWAFMYDGQPYFAGYRVLSTNGIQLPVLNAFKMLGKLGPTRLPLTSSAAIPLDTVIKSSIRGTNPTIDGLAAQNDTETQVLVWNYHDNLVTVAPAHVQVKVSLPAAWAAKVRLTHYRMDTTHSNAYTAWLAMGSPQSPTTAQISQLTAAMQLQLLDSITMVALDSTHSVTVAFDLPRFGVSLITLDNPGTSGTRRGAAIPATTLAPAQIRIGSRDLIVSGGEYSVSISDVRGRQVAAFQGRGETRFPLSRLHGKGAFLVKVDEGGRTAVERMVRE
jgi:xylan 1,4-beta-xylosidase